MPLAKKSVSDLVWELDENEERTIERRVRVREPRPAFETKLTTRMKAIDPELLALARGEVSPPLATTLPPPILQDDPFGGLILVVEEEDEESSWLMNDVEPEPFSTK